MVGKSKVISGLNDWQAHRRRKDTIMGSSVGPDAWAQVRDPKGTIGELFVPTFHAGLTNNPDAKTPGGNFLPATVTRATSATYVDISGTLQLAGVNESRQEYLNGQPLGTLMEPASTNKCVNFNANPDEALTGWGFTGAPALFYRVNDSSELRAAGLHNICTSGFVLCLDNTAGTGSASIRQSTGITGNTNTHSMYAYCRKDAASAANGQIKVSGGVAQQFSNTSYERIEIPGFTPPDNNTWFELVALAGAKVYMVLNQLEEQPVPTSTIVTEGAAASRAVDGLQWSLTDSQGRNILNQPEGMAAILWRPGFSDSDLGTGSVQTGRLLNTLGPRFLFHQKTAANANNFVLDDGVTTAVITVTSGWVANRDYLVTARWFGVNKHIRFKAVGAWATEVSAAYSGSFPEDGNLRLYDLADAPQIQRPAHCRDVYLWSEDKGAAWLESFFSGTAN